MPRNYRSLGVSLVLPLLAVAPLLAGARTADHYPVANGIGSAAVRLDDGRLDSFRPAPYAALDEGVFTPELCFDAYFALRRTSAGGSFSTWLTSVAVDEVRALADANAVVVVQRPVVAGASLRVETAWLSPHSLDRPAVLALVTVTNEGAATVDGLSFPSIANFRMGSGGEGNQGESASYDAARDTVVETGARGALAVRALGGAAGALSVNHTMTPSDPFPLVRDGVALPTVDASGVRDNVVHGFTFAPATASGTAGSGAATTTSLAPGASLSFGVVIAYAPQSSASAVSSLVSALHAWIAGRGAQQIFDDEVAASRAYVASAALPAGLSDDERALWGWSLALLRAAQVREDPHDLVDGSSPRRRPQGQIVASLPPGIWNITWVRDAAYAIEGLLAAGRVDEATAALRFFVDGDAGEYADYVGRDYLLSVTRSYGGGREESDFNAGGPNVEWDNFGLFLRAFARALDAGAALDDAIPAVKDGVADVLLSLTATSGPGAGLLVPDSSIWETHWEQSFESQGRRTYLYSSATASAGLRAFGALLDARGDADGAAYVAAGDALASAIAGALVTSGASARLVASLEEKNGASLDAAVIEALNRDVVDARGALAQATLASMQGLRSSATPGYFRNDEGGEYDSKEWLVVDLWLARAFRRAGLAAPADAPVVVNAAHLAESERLLAHVTRAGIENLGQIPELLADDGGTNNGLGRVDGATPMMGFGAGAYLSALADRAADLGLTDPGPGEGEGEGEASEGEGEGAEGEGEASEGEGEGAEGEGEAGDGGDEVDGGDIETEGCAAAGAPALVALLAVLRRRRAP